MSDTEKLNQCVLIAKALWFLPPPARREFAVGLYDLGVRVHPELATQQIMVSGVPGMGAHAPQRPVSRSGRDQWALVREWAPDLADKADAATTEAQKQEILAEIRTRYSDIIAEAEQRITAEAERLGAGGGA